VLQTTFRRGIALLLAGAGPLPALAAEGEAHAEQPSIMAGDVGNIVATLIIFLLVVGILGRYAWGPLLRILQDRERTIRESLESARRDRESAERLLDEYKRQIEQARAEATAIVDEGRRDAEEARRRIHDEARSEANQMIERARREIRLAADSAVKDIYDQMADVTTRVAATLVERELSPKDHEKFIADSLEQMKHSGGPKLN